ncbi:polysaccharide biosynthesis/export family protein [Flavobacterium sp.]|uniref:polysaccharide biosynthesis/export family protein n=1 Tax=Flavobacterium sp. TaxID=239 RepID=UPI0039E290AD
MNKTILILLVVAGLFFVSCVPTKDLVYLQKKDKNDTINTINPVVSKPYRIQTNDVLIITIKAIDPKLVAIFTPTERKETSMTEAGLYFDGFHVDDHGNIRMPILGEVNVIGYTLERSAPKGRKEIARRNISTRRRTFLSPSNCRDSITRSMAKSALREPNRFLRKG